MKQDNSLPKSMRLGSRKRLERLFKEGESEFAYPFRCLMIVDDAQLLNSDCAETNIKENVAIVVSVPKRKHKRAVVRNLLKRRTKEAFRTTNGELKQIVADNGKRVDLALIYVGEEVADYRTIKNGVEKLVKKIAKRI